MSRHSFPPMQKLLHFLDPRTRAKRLEYLIALAAVFVLGLLVPELEEALDEFELDFSGFDLFFNIFLAALFLIFIIRRLRDTGLSWLWILLLLIPLVNFIFLITLCFLPTDNFKKKQAASEPTSDPQPKSLPNSAEPESTPKPEPESEPEPEPELTELEQSLVNKYSALYQQYKNFTPEEAADLATTLVKEAKQEALQNHTYDLPTNLGSLVLQNTSPTDQYAKAAYDLIQRRLPRLRSEGVTDKDIKWWWNFSQIERSMIIKNDEMEYHNFFVTQLLKTQTQFPKKETAQNAAHTLTNKRFPIYTQNLQDDPFSPDDPLPYELKERVDAFMDHAVRFTDFQQTLQQLQTFSTFNAFVRQQITDNRL